MTGPLALTGGVGGALLPDTERARLVDAAILGVIVRWRFALCLLLLFGFACSAGKSRLREEVGVS